MTHLELPGANPEVRKSGDKIVVLLRPTNASAPIEEWIKIFNHLADNTAYEAGMEGEDLVLAVSFAGWEDQASTDAILDAVVELMAATDAEFEEVRTEERTMRDQVQDWWTRRMHKDHKG